MKAFDSDENDFAIVIHSRHQFHIIEFSTKVTE